MKCQNLKSGNGCLIPSDYSGDTHYSTASYSRFFSIACRNASKYYQDLQIVQTFREGKKVKQRVVSTLGRLDQLQEKTDIESITHSQSKFSEDILMVLTGKSDIKSDSLIIGPVLIIKRLWEETGLSAILRELLSNRKYEFDLELAVFITVLHRLLMSGSDRACEKWMTSYRIPGSESIMLHHFYRAMAFLGDALEDKLKGGAKSLIGNKGYRKYLKVTKDTIQIDPNKIKEEERFDGKWVLTSNMDMSAEQIALKYKELWMVESVFRQVKSILYTRPIYHKTDESIRGNVVPKIFLMPILCYLSKKCNLQL